MEHLDFYVEMYVRALTVDLNHLEDKKRTGSSTDVEEMETHLVAIYEKLSTLFIGFSDLAVRECMFSAFSLIPTKERLQTLQTLTKKLVLEDKKGTPAFVSEYVVCNCQQLCVGPCRRKSTLNNVNPLLIFGIKNVSQNIYTDLVIVLENVRGIKLRYCHFDWQTDMLYLKQYYKTYTIKMAMKRPKRSTRNVKKK